MTTITFSDGTELEAKVLFFNYHMTNNELPDATSYNIRDKFQITLECELTKEGREAILNLCYLLALTK